MLLLLLLPQDLHEPLLLCFNLLHFLDMFLHPKLEVCVALYFLSEHARFLTDVGCFGEEIAVGTSKLAGKVRSSKTEGRGWHYLRCLLRLPLPRAHLAPILLCRRCLLLLLHHPNFNLHFQLHHSIFDGKRPIPPRAPLPLLFPPILPLHPP